MWSHELYVCGKWNVPETNEAKECSIFIYKYLNFVQKY